MNVEKLINISWYMKRKPYSIHSDADIFYMKICRRLFIIINELATEHGNVVDLDEEGCRALAYVITAYFEDVVSGIGFWQSVIDLNRKHFKKRLPFFDAKVLEDEEQSSDDIVSADIHYLLYVNYAAMNSIGEEREFVFFENRFFHDATDRIYNYLAEIEEIYTTKFYEQYLVPDNDYVDFKNKLSWFALEGYVTGIEFTLRMEDFSLSLQDKKTDKRMFSAYVYAEADRLLFQQPSISTAYTAVDIFAGALRCNEAKKEAIRSLKLRPYGMFRFQNESAGYITFLHTATGEEYKVSKNSFTKPPKASQSEYWLSTFAKWNNEYCLSGLCFATPMKSEEIDSFNQQNQQSFLAHFPPYREQIIKTALDFRNEAYRYFGKDLTEFSSGKELQKNLDSFNEWHFKIISEKTKPDKMQKPAKLIMPKEFIDEKDVTLFIPPADGFEFIWIQKSILHTLQMPSPEKASVQERYEVLSALTTSSISSDYWFYIRKHYPLPNLSFFVQCNVAGDEDFEALLRIYKPHDFSASKLPRFSTFNSEKISHEEMKKISRMKKLFDT